MRTATTPEPGWYPDPTAPDRLRLWDGQAWTEQSRPWNPAPPPPPADPAPPAAPVPAERRNPVVPSRRRRMIVEGTGLGLALLVTGSSIRPSWGSPAQGAARPAHQPKTASATGGPSPTQPLPPVDCRLAASRPSPARVVGWLHDQNLAISLTTSGAIPDGACGVAAFTDPNAPSPNQIVAYPDAESAAAAAATPAPSQAGAQLRLAEGIYLMILDPALTGLREQYRLMLAAYVAQTNPAVVTPPTSSTTAPVSTSTTRRRPASRK